MKREICYYVHESRHRQTPLGMNKQQVSHAIFDMNDNSIDIKLFQKKE